MWKINLDADDARWKKVRIYCVCVRGGDLHSRYMYLLCLDDTNVAVDLLG